MKALENVPEPNKDGLENAFTKLVKIVQMVNAMGYEKVSMAKTYSPFGLVVTKDGKPDSPVQFAVSVKIMDNNQIAVEKVSLDHKFSQAAYMTKETCEHVAAIALADPAKVCNLYDKDKIMVKAQSIFTWGLLKAAIGGICLLTSKKQ